MGQIAQAPRHNRTITVDFSDEATYFELLSHGKAFVEFILTTWKVIGRTLDTSKKFSFEIKALEKDHCETPP